MNTHKQEKGHNSKAQDLINKFTRRELREKGVECLIDLIFKMDRDILELRKKYERAEMALETTEKEYNALKSKLTEKKNDSHHNKYIGYDKSLGWVGKVCFILERAGQSMSCRQIKEALLSLEPDLNDRWLDIDNYVSQILRSAVIRGAVLKIKCVRHRGYVYQVAAGKAND